jgi:DNA replicative helicase MCM subunit Mcm2 (Cdc46/Mcm family)
LYVSIRPEKIVEVNADIRDQWIIETCKNTKDRIEAIFEAMKMEDSNENKLRELGFSKELSEGIIFALKNYGKIDLNKYIQIVQESLQYLIPGQQSLPDLKASTEKQDEEKVTVEETPPPEEEKEIDEGPKFEDIQLGSNTQPTQPTTTDITPEEKKEEETSDDSAEIEKKVLKIIKDLEGEDGAPWDAITDKCKNTGILSDNIEEALTSLMDKGLIYEPVLGTIKTT